MPKELKDLDRIYLPTNLATIPIDGEVLTNRFWSVDPERGLVFVRQGSGKFPQCNTVRRIAEEVATKIHPGCHVEFMTVVFLGHLKPIRRKKNDGNL